MSEPEPVIEPEKKKKTIEHKLITMKEHPIQWLTSRCLLKAYDPNKDRTDLSKAYALQRDLRRQYYRVIEVRKADGKAKQRLTYCLNCRPSGFTVDPWSLVCSNTRVCPWCFVRRLYSSYQQLTDLDPKIRNLHSLLMWKREVPLSDKLPFFNTQYGPHQWCQALITVQYVVPMLSRGTSDLTLTHVGFQVVPKGLDYGKALRRRAVNPALNFRFDEQFTNHNVKVAMERSMIFPWSELLDQKNINQFMQLYDWNPGARLVRTSRSTPKGEHRGN